VAGPLAGVRVIDCSAVLAGPLSTMILADQGAAVVKVEPPGLGDIVRYLGASRAGVSALFANANRGKRSIALNLKDPRGLDVFTDMIRDADVLVENFRPGATERLGIDEPAMRAVNRRLIYVSLTGFGPTGPRAHHRVYDNVIQGYSGMTAVQGDPATGRPEIVRQLVCDKVTALTTAQAITAALLARANGGDGQRIDIAMLDAAVAFLWPDGMMNETLLGDDVLPAPSVANAYRVTKTADGYATAMPLSDAEFAAICRALDVPELADDPRFATLPDRMTRIDEWAGLLQERAQQFSTTDLVARMQAGDVPSAALLTPGEVPTDEQVVHNHLVGERDDPTMGRLRQPRPAARFAATEAHGDGAVPALGQHTDEILRETGRDAAAISALKEAGAVA
jgi:crotonobetainyl-CoA:carnitine CoA-transferase CaiB-like acyl-CoA transferase